MFYSSPALLGARAGCQAVPPKDLLGSPKPMGVGSTNCTHKRGSRSHGGARLLSEDAFGPEQHPRVREFCGSPHTLLRPPLNHSC